MSDKPTRLSVAPETPTFIARDDFKAASTNNWRTAKDSYREAHRRMSTLLNLLHDPRNVRIRPHVTGALWEAKQLRDDVDRMVVALDQIMAAARAVEDEQP